MRRVLASSSVRAYCFVALSACSAIAFAVWFVPEGSWGRRPPTETIDLSRDPALGFRLPAEFEARSDALGRNIPAGSRDLVVFGGMCTGCSLNAVVYTQLPTQEFDRVFVLYESKARDIRSAIKTSPPDKVYLIAEPTGRLVHDLNAVTTCRWYVFSGGKFVKSQISGSDRSWGSVQ